MTNEWDNEPDICVWIDADTDKICCIKRSSLGVWCGYVGVTANSLLHGKDHSAIDVDVHGGLTFSGEHKDLASPFWWFGFDCGHCCDVVPRLGAMEPNARYRNMAYAKCETNSLANQITEIEKGLANV